ncbi:hypothetical protein AB0M32_42640 [Streptomyces sp. NPDC051985]|uniref:hypothetical protein n=1 Tax=Streptomyces sp. NPDC051985 TaxID=3155807 RepID=UPI003446B71D
MPQDRESLVELIGRHPQALSVELVAGSCDPLLTVATDTMEWMSAYVLALGRVESVTVTRTHRVQHLNHEGSRWRFNSLSHDQRRDLAEPESGAPRRGPGVLTPEERTA